MGHVHSYYRRLGELTSSYYSDRETKGKTLEEIAEIFGDDVAFTEYIGAAGNATTVAQKKIEVEPEANVHQIEHSIEKK